MLRSTAKNHAFTAIVTSPDQYAAVQKEMQEQGGTSLTTRKKLAAKAFGLSAAYDSAIAIWFNGALGGGADADADVVNEAPVVVRAYQPEYSLKYGCNPHQKPAQILSRVGSKLPFHVLNGIPGYINLLDAANAW
jgi:phosphoribosylaminoimidazolecarboxamide formyltransferase/IMP cyclohydrolase